MPVNILRANILFPLMQLQTFVCICLYVYKYLFLLYVLPISYSIFSLKYVFIHIEMHICIYEVDMSAFASFSSAAIAASWFSC